MPTRIEIELTSSSGDGSWTWRAAGAREPRGVLDGSILPGGVTVGDQLRVETEHDVDGIRVLSVVPAKEKAARNDLLELLPTGEPFEPVVQQRAQGGRSDDRRSRPPRRDRPDRDDDARRARRPDRRDGPERGDRGRPGRNDRDSGRRTERPDGEREDRERHRHRPHFTPPPEVPQRPKPKRLRPGKQHRTDVLGSLPEEQRPIAELALQGMPAVRQRLRDDNARLKAEGKPEMPEAGVLRMAEELIPRLRVADWLDRADAAHRQLEHLDLRDLRSVVASADDPLVARDESTRTLAAELKAALLTKQEEELALWLTDVEAALDVGRVVRALRLSSVPPKAGVPFPAALAARLGEATTAALQPTDGPDRWSAVLEAAAFSPVRSLVAPAAAAGQRSDELLATVRRLAPLLPQVAALYEIEVPARAAVPKPLRPASRRREPTRRPASEGEGKGRQARAPSPRGPTVRQSEPKMAADVPEPVAGGADATAETAAPEPTHPPEPETTRAPEPEPGAGGADATAQTAAPEPTHPPEPETTRAPEPEPGAGGADAAAETAAPEPTHPPEPETTRAPEPEPGVGGADAAAETAAPEPTHPPEPETTRAPEPEPVAGGADAAAETAAPEPTHPPEPETTRAPEPEPGVGGADAAAETAAPEPTHPPEPEPVAGGADAAAETAAPEPTHTPEPEPTHTPEPETTADDPTGEVPDPATADAGDPGSSPSAPPDTALS